MKLIMENWKRFLGEGTVNLNGYTAWTEDWNDCTVLLDGEEYPIQPSLMN